MSFHQSQEKQKAPLKKVRVVQRQAIPVKNITKPSVTLNQSNIYIERAQTEVSQREKLFKSNADSDIYKSQIKIQP